MIHLRHFHYNLLLVKRPNSFFAITTYNSTVKLILNVPPQTDYFIPQLKALNVVEAHYYVTDNKWKILEHKRSTGSSKSGHFGRIGLHQLKLMISFSRRRPMWLKCLDLFEPVLLYIHCSRSSPFINSLC